MASFACEFLINVNFYLYRNLIEKSYSRKLSEREVEVRSSENEELIRKFEQSLQGVAQTTGSQNRLQGNVFQNVGNLRFQGFCSGICVMGGIILVSVYCLLFLFNSCAAYFGKMSIGINFVQFLICTSYRYILQY